MGVKVEDAVKEEIKVKGWEDFLRKVEESGFQREIPAQRFELLEELSVTHNWYTVGRYADNKNGSSDVVLRYVDYLKVEPSEDPQIIAANL